MKKSFITALLVLVACAPAVAQISTGNPSAKKITVGNRPQAGDFGLYLGATSDMFKGIGKSDIKIDPLPLVNLKYMLTDQWEARVGFEFYRKRETLKGDIAAPDENDENKTMEVKDKVVESNNRIMPGIAYHFSPKNILDVYAGAEATIGWSRNSVYKTVGDDFADTRKASIQLGAGAFIGLQAFIGNLPLAIGVEYGISTLFDGRLRYKNVSEVDGEKQTTYTKDIDALPMMKEKGLGYDAYDELKASKGQIGSQFRITLSYYFK